MRLQRWGCAALALASMLMASPTKAAGQTAVEQRLSALEQRIERLEKRVDAALAKSGSAPEPSASSDRLASLDAKVAALEKQAVEVKKSPVVLAGKDGFGVASADKQYSLKISGYGQLDSKTFYDDGAKLLTNSFALRRARMNFDASLGKLVSLRIAPEFGNGSITLYDAYVDLKFAPYFSLRGGKYKTPYGLELLANDTELMFIERSLVNDLVPNRDEGVQIFGAYKKYFTYAVSVSNGMVDGASSVDADVNDGKDLTARLFFTPAAEKGPKALKGLGFGLGVSTGRQNGTTLASYKTTGGQASFFSYASGVTASGNRLRYTPQLYYYYGPFGFISEYAETAQDLTLGAVKGRIVNHAWQTSGSVLLTGEKKSFGKVTPKRTLDGSTGAKGWGAWELAARYTEFNVDPKVYSRGFAKASSAAESARAWTIGLNWYPSAHVKFSLNYDRTRFLKGASAGNRPDEKSFSQRLQFTF